MLYKASPQGALPVHTDGPVQIYCSPDLVDTVKSHAAFRMKLTQLLDETGKIAPKIDL